MKQKTHWNFLLLCGSHPIFHPDQLMQLFLVVGLPCSRLLSFSEVRSESIWTFKRREFVAENQRNYFFKLFRINCSEQRQVIWILEDSKVKYLYFYLYLQKETITQSKDLQILGEICYSHWITLGRNGKIHIILSWFQNKKLEMSLKHRLSVPLIPQMFNWIR